MAGTRQTQIQGSLRCQVCNESLFWMDSAEGAFMVHLLAGFSLLLHSECLVPVELKQKPLTITTLFTFVEEKILLPQKSEVPFQFDGYYKI